MVYFRLSQNKNVQLATFYTVHSRGSIFVMVDTDLPVPAPSGANPM